MNGFTRRGFFGGLLVAPAAFGFETPRTAQSVDLERPGMRALITGSGSALIDPLRGNASVAVIVDGTVLQFDFGRRAMDNLALAGINPVNVDYIFFTHLHFDHIATYDYHVISSWIAGRQTPIEVYGPLGTIEMSDNAVYGMHAVDIEFVEKLLAGWPKRLDRRPKSKPPIQVRDIGAGVVAETDSFKVTAVDTPHYRSMGVRSLGYRIDSEHGSAVVSGDTAPSDEIAELAKGADLLIHECVIPDPGMTKSGKFAEKPPEDEPPEGHTSPTQLGQLAQRAGVKKLVATHLAPYTSVDAAVEMSSMYLGPRLGDEIWGEFVHAMKRQYDGPVVLAEDGMVLEI